MVQVEARGSGQGALCFPERAQAQAQAQARLLAARVVSALDWLVPRAAAEP